MKKEDAIELSRDIIEDNELFNLNSIVSYLISCRNKGENVYIDFPNGSLGIVDRFYSCDIDYDKAYMLCFGIPYEIYKHLMEIQNKVTEEFKYELVSSITNLYTDLKKAYISEVEEIRKNNNSFSHKI